jgi:hypothetical protein
LRISILLTFSLAKYLLRRNQINENFVIDRRILGLSVITILIQLIDIVIHVATDQAEPVRIISNIIIMVWLAIVASRRFTIWQRQLAFIAIGLYSLLNLVFLTMEGVTNSESGELRIALFILVGFTLILSIGLTVVFASSGSEK